MKKVVLLSLLFLFPIANTIFAYSVDTHKIISEKATENSKLALDKGDYLKNLGFQNNISEKFLVKSVKKLIKDGSVNEDEPFRYFNHYHNPLKSWAAAGLNDITTGQSSLVWPQYIWNEFSWQAMRQYYLDALTGSTNESREINFAKTFEGLGHLIHLLQDTAQPAHVRNDAHVLDPYSIPLLPPLFNKLEFIQRLETWSNNNPDEIEIVASQPVFPTVNYNVFFPVYNTISQLFDTDPDTYDGTNPSTSLSQGLAEYTNANFFSDDTIFAENFDIGDNHYFPFPREEDTIKYDEDIGGGVYRTYFKKISNGEHINHLATVERLYRYIFPFFITPYNYYFLDENCHKDYTEKLIPRAVGYSTELINYFFRGEIDVDLIDAESFTITNSSSETMDGTFTLYYDAADGNRHQVFGGLWYFDSQSQYGPLGAGQTSDELTFTEPTDIAEGTQYTLVFKGTLGSESNAVVGNAFSGAGGCDFPIVDTCSVPCSDFLLSCQADDWHKVGFLLKTSDPDDWDVYSWDFGDGEFLVGDKTDAFSLTHTYATAGTYTVTCTVLDDVITTYQAGAALPDGRIKNGLIPQQRSYLSNADAHSIYLAASPSIGAYGAARYKARAQYRIGYGDSYWHYEDKETNRRFDLTGIAPNAHVELWVPHFRRFDSGTNIPNGQAYTFPMTTGMKNSLGTGVITERVGEWEEVFPGFWTFV